MEVLYPRCCGLDVHKSSITACVLLAQSGKPLKHIRLFGCTTRELRDMVAWLREFGVEHVAIAYASHCTSLGRCATFLNRALLHNLTPLAFFGGSGPGSS